MTKVKTVVFEQSLEAKWSLRSKAKDIEAQVSSLGKDTVFEATGDLPRSVSFSLAILTYFLKSSDI